MLIAKFFKISNKKETLKAAKEIQTMYSHKENDKNRFLLQSTKGQHL